MENSLETANTELSALQQEYEEQRNKYTTSLEEAEKRMKTELEATETAAKELQEQLEGKLAEQTHQKEASEKRVEQLDKRVLSLENECKAKDLELTTLRVQVTHSKESVERMQKEHDSIKAQLKAKEEQLVRAFFFRI